MNKLTEPPPAASTESRGYIKEPKTLDEFEHNARFQLDNVKGYLMMDADGLPSSLNAARIKSGCLIQAAYALERALLAEFNEREAAAIALLDKMKGDK
jgi:hypothetical protein